MSDKESLELELRLLAEAARAAYERIEHVLAHQSYIDRIAFSRTWRIKEVHRMMSKVQVIRSSDVNFQPSMLPDVLGFRIVTYFQSGILEALEILIALAEHDGRLGESPFKKNDVHRITLHTSRPEEDALSIARRVESIAKAHNLTVERSTRDTLYSSVHVILCCNVEIRAADGGNVLIPLLVEFQLRSVFEEAWGQLSHLLSYGRTRATVDQKTWQLHLGVLKAMIDGCIQYSELIKEQSGIDLRNAEAEKERSRSAASPKKILTDLPTLTVSIRAQFETALELECEAQELGDDNPAAGPKFSNAAQLFQKLQVILTQVSDITDAARDRAMYIAETEGAYCRLFSQEENAVAEAVELYQRITQRYTNDAVSRYRYAQALRRHNELDRAIKMLQESITLFSSDAADAVLEADHWIRSSAYRELGYVYWLSAEKEDDLTEKKGKVREAIANTRHALAFRGEQEEHLRSTNNFIYYAWEERNLGAAPEEYQISDQELRASLERLLKISSEPGSVLGVELWSAMDTAARALDFLNDEIRASEAAGKVVSILIENMRKRASIPAERRPSSKEIQHHLTSDEFDAYLYATTLLGSRS